MKHQDELLRRALEQREMLDKITRRGEILRRVEEQSLLYDRVNQQIASIREIHSQTAASVVGQLAKHIAADYRPLIDTSIFSASKQVAETIQKLTQSGALNTALLGAQTAAQAAVKSIYEMHKLKTGEVVQNIGRLAVADSLVSLSSVFAGQLAEMEERDSPFARTMAQTLRTSFEELGDEDLESVVTLKSIDEKLESIRKAAPTNFDKQLQRLVHFIAIATFVLLLIPMLDSSSSSQPQIPPQPIEPYLHLVEDMIRKAEEKISIIYIVDRQVLLKSKPKNKSVTLALLVKDEEVRFIDTGSHQWILVEYDDGSKTLTGWVNKKYLRRVR